MFEFYRLAAIFASSAVKMKNGWSPVSRGQIVLPRIC